jgi:hypothetical protein
VTPWPPSSTPSQAQLKVLDLAGIDTSSIWCKGLASEIMNKLAAPRQGVRDR